MTKYIKTMFKDSLKQAQEGFVIAMTIIGVAVVPCMLISVLMKA